ncbi:MAG TPA: hypothetical protein VKA44_07135, partial [Gemmatimonadota bacterium]|nr:hypothetical protein [Gemmatimonadota bacterium]
MTRAAAVRRSPTPGRFPGSTLHSGLLVVLAAATCVLGGPSALSAQSRPAPVTDAVATLQGGRPLPGPVYETPEFSRAVRRGTRTRTGRPGAGYWVQHARYSIDARLEPDSGRVTGRESVWYLNRSPDTLSRVAVYLRQNVFAPGSPRLNAAPVTGGVALSRVAVGTPERELAPVSGSNPAMPINKAPSGMPGPGRFAVRSTVMWIGLPRALPPGDSLRLAFAWSYRPAPAPSDGREGHDDGVWYMGYWYPQMAVYDDVDGWVTDPYLDGAEFYMDPADYDVRLTVPSSFVVGATGTLQDPASVLPERVRDSLAVARKSGRVVHVVTRDDRRPGGTFAPGRPARTWHYVARDVRDFAWGASDTWAWDATRALVGGSAAAARASTEGWTRAPAADSGSGAAPDTVVIHSFYRLTDAASAWRIGGARYTRDAVERLSDYLWPYPWPHMTSMEGVLDGGGMEYPMMTL